MSPQSSCLHCASFPKKSKEVSGSKELMEVNYFKGVVQIKLNRKEWISVRILREIVFELLFYFEYSPECMKMNFQW